MPALIALFQAGFVAVVGWFSSLAASSVAKITIEGAKFLAWRSFIIFLLGAVFPILAYNIFCYILGNIMEVSLALIQDNTGDITTNLTLSFTSLAGWVANQIGLAQVISVYLTAISIRFILSLIPFIGR